ncbi:MAG TPA: helicase-related protein [Pyrinomonadaceae bacterium]|jgi:superfamily II DNA or RNA helicase|nr:helicase-related protein [Pyrinomonadaceae bacterium]
MNPGSIVRCRNRDWVLVPSDDENVYLLRPLTGATDEIVAVHRGLSNLIGYELGEERVRTSQFNPPTVEDLSDAASAHLLWQAARLTLREGATPFRSLGRISIRPRVYQFVPLLMALRLDPIRMLIADDVGVGKTIEALLIARELYERGEIRRLCVLCPPYLCDQWQKELSEKFNLDAVVIRSGTVSQLERRTTGHKSIYKHYPIQVASIDFVKSERNKHLFLLDRPDFIIVDEAHGSAAASGRNQNQQQRHALIKEIANSPAQHLILLTATPHSGIEEAFQSLLSLLKPKFNQWHVTSLNESERVELARHFVQRTRRDIEHDWEGDHCFPQRDAVDETYALSREYHNLFIKTYDFCSEMVRSGERMDKRRQRVRYWGALALLRCVMSSPAAALAAIETRHDALSESGDDDEIDFRSFVFESSNDATDDEQPTPPVESAEQTLDEKGKRQLRDLGRLASALQGDAKDTKLARCAELTSELLKEKFNPIIWCRYIATAEYVAEGLAKALRRSHPKVRVMAITGRLGDDERRAKIDELAKEPQRVLVATDCLSEGINLQDAFNATLHYDLPWNPNRLEQREGRVDRFGQRSETVKTIRYFSPDSAVDGIVLDVLLNKAREIHRTLGTYVPVPAESETVTQAVLNALFLRGKRKGPDQLEFDFGTDIPEIDEFHKSWDRDAERERVSRTRFAQRAIKPDEVKRELEATDSVLGDTEAVREFVLNAAQRIGLRITPEKANDVFRVAVNQTATSTLPPAITYELPSVKDGDWRVSFISPTPEGADYLGRNHRFVVALARFLMEEALTKHGSGLTSRCGVIRTKVVRQLTTILLLRVRYLVNQPQLAPLLAEEVLVTGFNGDKSELDDAEAMRLLVEAKADANVPMSEKRELAKSALEMCRTFELVLESKIKDRSSELEKSHKRVRQAVSLRVRELSVASQLPPDLLGILVLQPLV